MALFSNYNYRMQVKDTFERKWKGAVVTSYRRYLSIYLQELQKHKKKNLGQGSRSADKISKRASPEYRTHKLHPESNRLLMW